jgi:uncharacterized membrane protein
MAIYFIPQFWILLEHVIIMGNMVKSPQIPSSLAWMIGISALILFLCSSLRHILFQSTAFDLGIFDQAIYLISQGLPPISSFMGYHILGDHAAYIMYPIALLYKIYPSVYWLFIIQAIALAIGALPTWYLAIQAGLKTSQATAMAAAYLLYPVVFNVNLFDFHPEVMAIPALLAAVWYARQGKFGWFCASIIFILGCKAVLSFTVAAMGVWLLVFEKRRWCGTVAICAAVAWFVTSSQLIIPFFSGREAAAVGRYSYLGNSVLEIAQNLFLKPGLVFGKLFSADNLGYLPLLLAPVIWGLSWVGIQPLVGAIPCVALNLLADYQPQKDLVHQYSLPALPFLLLAVISTLAAGKGWFQNQRAIVLWSLVTFVLLAKFTYFGGKYLESLDTWQTTREAIALVDSKGSVLTSTKIAPHLSHRSLIQMIDYKSLPDNFQKYDYLLFDLNRHNSAKNQKLVTNLFNKINETKSFELRSLQDEVFLFTKKLD